MTPLVVTAHVPMGMLVRSGTVHLDALVMAVAARRLGLAQPQTAEDVRVIEIPIARSACGRYHLASASVYDIAASELRYVQRRFPTKEAVHLAGPKLRRIDDGAGPQKSFRIPRERVHPDGGAVWWWCVGDRAALLDLLSDVTHLGGRRGVGEGMLALRGPRWEVEEMPGPWPGFPVLGPDGRAARNLPLDHAGLGEHRRQQGRLAPPYWLREGEQWIAGPAV